MSDKSEVKLSSLNIVKDEFLATIQTATNQLEQFIGGRERADLLGSCLDLLQQLRGVMKIIQLEGGDVLAEEMIAALKTVPAGADTSHDATLAALSTAAFVLSRYFEYAQQYERSLPVMLLPFINELREAHAEKPLPDSTFFKMNAGALRPERADGLDYAADSARRFRHMYQVGLLGLLQGQGQDSSLGMMQRALERMDAIATGYPFSKLLWAASVAVLAAREQSVPFSKSRKMLLSALDRQLKRLVKEGESFLDVEPSVELLREFIYLAAVSGSTNKKVSALCQTFAVMPLGYVDRDVEEELQNLRGPGISTIQTVAEVVRDELRLSKNSLEMASQGGADLLSVYSDMISSLTRIAETLSVVGLATPAVALREQVARLSSWQASNHNADMQELADVADVVLYIESTMTAMEHMNLSQSKLAETNALDRDQIIAQSQLAEAEKVVLEEAQAGLALIKRSLATFMESGYDVIHVANLGKSLHSVRGGLVLLNMSRAAKVAECCAAFVEDKLMHGGGEGAIQQYLEAFADAVMSLEYFLESYVAVHKQDVMILEVAEDSVKALGYPVN